jgi:hypothetical protein
MQTQQQQQDVEGLITASGNSNLTKNVISSISYLASKANTSANPQLNKAGGVLDQLLRDVGDNPTTNQINNLLKLSKKVVSEANILEPTENWREDFELVREVATEYNELENDDALAEHVEQQIQEQQSSVDRGQAPMQRVVNEATGKAYYKQENGTLVAEEKLEEYLNEVAEKEFISAGGANPKVDLYEGLKDK